MNTFETELKNEITEVLGGKSREIKLSALSAVVHTAGNLVFRRGGVRVEIDLEDSSVARFVAELIKENGQAPEISLEKGHGIVRSGYRISVFGEEAKRLFSDLKIIEFESGNITEMTRGVHPSLVDTEEKIRAYVSGVFLGAGTVSVPDEPEKNAGYHFELRLSSQEFAREVMSLLAEFEVLSKSYDRDSTISVYIKESQAVSDVLAIMEANESVIKLQNIVVERMVSNNDNRKRNCNVANIDKSLIASGKQIASIDRIFARGLESKLSPELRRTAEVRRENPLASLDMLAEILEISKSAVNHRLRKLVEMGKEEDR